MQIFTKRRFYIIMICRTARSAHVKKMSKGGLMKKEMLYKGMKTFFYIAGFPLLLMILLITMAPMFNVEVMGNHAAIWVVVFFVLWGAFEAIRFVLNKFVGSKSEGKHKLALVITAAVAILLVVLPSAIYDASYKKQYEKDYDAVVSDLEWLQTEGLATDATVNLLSYDKVAGWHRDFTEKYKSEVYELINDHYDYLKANGLEHVYSEDFDNAVYDEETGEVLFGHKLGSREKLENTIAEAKAAVALWKEAKAELDELEAKLAIVDNKTATAEEKQAAQAWLDEKYTDEDGVNAALVRLKGAKLDLSVVGASGKSLHETLCEVLVDVVKDVLKGNNSEILAGDWTIELFGQKIDIKGLVTKIMTELLSGGYDLSEIVSGVITVDMIKGFIPSEIYTGIGAETVSAYESKIVGSAGLLGGLISLGGESLGMIDAEVMLFRINHYPQALAAGAVKFASYICVGIIVFSIFAVDYFSKKEKEAKKAAEGGEDR